MDGVFFITKYREIHKKCNQFDMNMIFHEERATEEYKSILF